MSYNIGQFRKDMLSQYTTDLNYTVESIEIQGDSSLGVRFTDKALKLTNTQFDLGINYYVKIGIKRLDTIQNLTVSLRNSTENNSSTQTIASFSIPQLDNSINQTAVIEMIISPNSSYDILTFTLQRTASDFTIENEEGTHGRIIQIDSEEVQISEIYNIIDAIEGVSYFNKIGVQGPPGLLMCINGEQIRINPSGIYEIRNGYKVNFMGFIVKNSDYFILDYQY